MKHYKTHYYTLIDEKLIYKPKHVLYGNIMNQIIIFILLRKHMAYIIIKKVIFKVNIYTNILII
jgi:hypothetical protein